MTFTEPNPVKQEIPPDESARLLGTFALGSEHEAQKAQAALEAAQLHIASFGAARAIAEQQRQQ